MSETNVLLISEEYPPFMFGGIGSVCHDLAFSLAKKGISTTVLCGNFTASKIAEEEPREHLKVFRVPVLDFPPRFLWFQLQNTKIFANLIEKSSVVHVVNPQAGATSVYFKKRFRKPLVTSIHGVPLVESKVFFSSPIRFWTRGDFSYNLFEYPLQDSLIRLCLANSERIAVCSNTTAEEMKKVYSKLPLRTRLNNVSVIYNGIDFDKMDEIEPDSSRDRKDVITILYYGRLYYRKGILDALEAIAGLSRSSTEFRFEIFGRGPLEHRINTLIRKWHMKDIAHFRGHVSYEELVREIKMSDIVVAPSLYEAQSVSILEAMACRKPVVAYDFSFSREIIKNMRNGLLAKPGNIADLTNKIELLLRDTKLRHELGENAYLHVMNNHNWDVLVKKYVDLYESAV
jgi:glycosyltransferase involved in cell wall biosynthesis